MKTFDSCCKAYHAILEEACAHFSSELGVEIRDKVMLAEVNLYLDLDNWPDNPELQALTEAQKQTLREWGPGYMQRLQAFHKKTDELEQARYQAVCQALRVLGEQMGAEFNGKPIGPLDQRVADVLSKADLLRKTQLDGFGYVDVLEPESNFAKGFFKVTMLNKTGLFSDLKLCSQIRENGSRFSDEEKARLGFHQE
ncbi:hypothetical protein FEV13_00370 (plasmid) [Stutzerimonas degradans]|jgi:hypothetical protein|nr:hypothetical protein FEV13_00370 [Stutzerimonas degradans]